MTSHWTPPSPDDVRALRKRYGLTQEQLADLAMVTPRHAQRYEAAEKTLSHQPPTRHVWQLLLIKLGEEPIDQSLRRRAARMRRGG